MKKNLAFALTALSLLVGLSACGGNGGNGGNTGGSDTQVTPDKLTFDVELASGYSKIVIGETDTAVVTHISGNDIYDFRFTSDNESVIKVLDDIDGTLQAVQTGSANITCKEEMTGVTETIKVDVVNNEYHGISYATADYETKGKILGTLEKYAMDNHLTGIPLYEDGAYVMYSPRIKIPVEHYITGYGYGIISDGEITSDLASENKPEWKRYIHQGTPSDPLKINAMNDKGSEVSGLAGNITSAYYGTKLNETKTGYEWYPVLAADDWLRPKPVNAVNGYADTWQIKVKTYESDGLTYGYLGKYDQFKDYPVKLEDYVFAFKLLYTGAFNYYRGAESAADKSYGIAGAQKYFNATKAESSNPINNELFNNTVGVKADPNTNILTIKMVKPVSEFFAMYGLSNSNYQPVPEEFIKTIGGGDMMKGAKYYGTFTEAEAGKKGTTPVDNILSLAPYTLEAWEESKSIVFKRNPNWVEFKNPALKDRYKIEGIKYIVYGEAATNPEQIYNEFMHDKVDSCSIPKEHLSEMRDDPRTRQLGGTAVFKLNVNSTTPERWEELFGENGSITKTPKAKYWDVKPWMSNKNFLNGLMTSINRKEFAQNRGNIPSNNYFSSNYLIDPEEGISYNSTQDHINAMKNYFPETYGYNKQVAIEYFKRAVNELVASEAIIKGTPSNPTKIGIEIWWMNPSDPKEFGEDIKKYFEDAFNDEQVSGGTVKLVVNNETVTKWDDVYYKHLMVGQFDLGFGSISGNSMDPLNFMEVLKSDNSSGFTLNWGVDTSKVDPKGLNYDGKSWSYDNLWLAADRGTVVDVKGRNIRNVTATVDPNFVQGWSLTTPSGQLKVEIAVLDVKDVVIENYDVQIYVVGVGNYTFTKEQIAMLTTGSEKITITVNLTNEDIKQINKMIVDPKNEKQIDEIKEFGWSRLDYGKNDKWCVEVHFTQKIGQNSPIQNYITADAKIEK